MESATSCLCDSVDPTDPTEYLEKLKQKYVDRTAKLQAQQRELERKIMKMESFIGNKNTLDLPNDARETCPCDTGIPKVFPETPVRDLQKPTINTDVIKNQKQVTQQCSFFQKMMENAKNMLSLKCTCPSTPTSPPTTETSMKDNAFRKCTCSSTSTSPYNTEENTKDGVFGKCTCSTTLTSTQNIDGTTSNEVPTREHDHSLQEKVVDYDISLTNKSSHTSNCSCDLSEPSTLQEISCSCNLIDSRFAQQQTSLNATTSTTGKRTGTEVDAATSITKTKPKSSGKMTFSSELVSEECSCEDCACESLNTLGESPEMKDAGTDNAVKFKFDSTPDAKCECPLGNAGIQVKAPVSNKQLSSYEPTKDTASKACTCCRNTNCPLRFNALSSAGVQVASETQNKSVNIEIPKPGYNVGVLCCNIPTCPSTQSQICKSALTNQKNEPDNRSAQNQCALVGSPLLNKKDFGDAAVQNKASIQNRAISASNVPCDCNTPQGPKNICDLSQFSLTSNDITEMKNIAELATREKQMKRQISELQRREKQYQEASKNVESLMTKTANPSCCCCQSKNGGDVGSEINKISKELRLENQILKNELEDMKLELKHCIEKVEGPMKMKLQVEKQKCECLQNELQDASNNMMINKTTYEKEMNQLKLQLCCACTNITELNEMNQRLKNDMNQLDCLCQKLEDDLIKQKVDEAETIKRLTNRKFNNNAISEEFRCESNLDVIARKLSKTIKELAPCDECSKLPAELAGAARCIKELTDMVRKRKVKSSTTNAGGCNCCQSRPPSELPSRDLSEDCCTCCGPREGEGEGRKDVKTLLSPDKGVTKDVSSKFNVGGVQSSYYSAKDMEIPCANIGHPCANNKGTGTREDTIKEETPVKDKVLPCSDIGQPCQKGKSQGPPIQVPSRLNQECYAPCSGMIEPVKDDKALGKGDAKPSEKLVEDEDGYEETSVDKKKSAEIVVEERKESKQEPIEEKKGYEELKGEKKEECKKLPAEEKDLYQKMSLELKEGPEQIPTLDIEYFTEPKEVKDETFLKLELHEDQPKSTDEPTTGSLTEGQIPTSSFEEKYSLTSCQSEPKPQMVQSKAIAEREFVNATPKLSKPANLLSRQCPWKDAKDLSGDCSCESCLRAEICKDSKMSVIPNTTSTPRVDTTPNDFTSRIEATQSGVESSKKDMSELPKDDDHVQFAKSLPDQRNIVPREIPFEEKRWGPEFPYDVQNKAYEILGDIPKDLHITTTITSSGTLEVITEGPAGLIATTMTYTKDGNIEVETQMAEDHPQMAEEREQPLADALERYTNKPTKMHPIGVASSIMSGPSVPDMDTPYSETSALTSNIASSSSGIKAQAIGSPDLTSGFNASSEAGARPQGSSQAVPITAIAEKQQSKAGPEVSVSSEFKISSKDEELTNDAPIDGDMQSSGKESEAKMPLSELEGITSTIGQLPSGEVFTPDQVISDLGMDQGDQAAQPDASELAAIDESTIPTIQIAEGTKVEGEITEVLQVPGDTGEEGEISAVDKESTKKEISSELTGDAYSGETGKPESVPTGARTICDRSCQSKNQTDQSCQCCECKTIGVSTSGDKETITETDEAMGRIVQDDHIEGTRTDTDSEFVTISDNTEHALAQTSSIKKQGDTTDDVTTIPATATAEKEGEEYEIETKEAFEAEQPELAEEEQVLLEEVKSKASGEDAKLHSEIAQLLSKDLDKKLSGLDTKEVEKPSDLAVEISEQVQQEIVYESKPTEADQIGLESVGEPQLIAVTDDMLLEHPELIGKTPSEQQELLQSLGYKTQKASTEAVGKELIEGISEIIEIDEDILEKHPELVGKTPSQQQALLRSLGYKAPKISTEAIQKESMKESDQIIEINEDILEKHPELVGKSPSQQQALLRSLGYKAQKGSTEAVQKDLIEESPQIIEVNEDMLRKHPELVGKTHSQQQALLRSLGYKAYTPSLEKMSEIQINDDILQKHPELLGKRLSEQQAILKSLGYKPSKAESDQLVQELVPSRIVAVDSSLLQKHPELVGLSREEQQLKLKELGYDFTDSKEQPQLLQDRESAVQSIKEQSKDFVNNLIMGGIISKDFLMSHPELEGKTAEEQREILKSLGFDVPEVSTALALDQSLIHIPVGEDLLEKYPELIGKTSKEQQEYLKSLGNRPSIAVNPEILKKHPSLIGKSLEEQMQLLEDMGYILDEVLERVDQHQRLSEEVEPKKKPPCKAPCSIVQVAAESTYSTPRVSSKEIKICKAPCSRKPSKTSPKPSTSQVKSTPLEQSESKSSGLKFITPEPSSRDVSICCKVCCRTTATDSIPTSTKPSVDKQASCKSICKSSCRSAATINYTQTPSISKKDIGVIGDASAASQASKSRSISLQQRPSSRDDSTCCRTSCRSISLQSSKTKHKEVKELVPARTESNTTSSSSDGRLKSEKKQKEKNPPGEVPSIVSELSDKERPPVDSTKRPKSSRKKRRKVWDCLKSAKCSCQDSCMCNVCSPHRNRDIRAGMGRPVRSCDCPSPGNMMMISPMMVVPPIQMSYSMPPTGHATNCRCNACLSNDMEQSLPPRREVSTRPQGESRMLQTESPPTMDENDRRGKKLANHPSSCECVDCLCMPKVKALARTKEYPVVYDSKQVFQVKVKCDTCTNAKAARRYLEQRSRIPIPTSRLSASRVNSGPSQARQLTQPEPSALPQSHNGLPPCECTDCICSECPDDTKRKPGNNKIVPPVTVKPSEQINKPEPSVTVTPGDKQKGDDVPCTCDVCSCPRSDLIKGDGVLGKQKDIAGKLPPTSESVAGAGGGGGGEACTCVECSCCGCCLKNLKGEPKEVTAEAEKSPSHQEQPPSGDIQPPSEQHKPSTADHPPDCECGDCTCPAIDAYRKYPHEGPSEPAPPTDDGTEHATPTTAETPIEAPPNESLPTEVNDSSEEKCECEECECPGRDNMPGVKVPPSETKPPPTESSPETPKSSAPGAGGPPNDEECLCIDCKCAFKSAEQPPSGTGVPPTESQAGKSPLANIPSCDCSPCQCQPCADPNKGEDEPCTCTPCECSDEVPKEHPEECDCPECICVVDTGTNPEPSDLPPKDEHPADCDCDECRCYDEILQDRSMQTTPGASPGVGDGKPTEKPSTKDVSTHPVRCVCSKCICPSEVECINPRESKVCLCVPECLCVDCVMKQSEKEIKVIPPSGDSAKPSSILKGANCTCDNCICIDCKGASAGVTKPSEPKETSELAPGNHEAGCTCAICRCDICSTKPGSGDKPASGDKPDGAHLPGCHCSTCHCEDCDAHADKPEDHPVGCKCEVCGCDVCSRKAEDESKASGPAGTPICICQVCACGPSKPPVNLAEPAAQDQETHSPLCICKVCTCSPSDQVGKPDGKPGGDAALMDPPPFEPPQRIDCNCKEKCDCVICSSHKGNLKPEESGSCPPDHPGLPDDYVPPPFEIPVRIECICKRCSCTFCNKDAPPQRDVAAQPSVGIGIKDVTFGKDVSAQQSQIQKSISTHPKNCTCQACTCIEEKHNQTPGDLGAPSQHADKCTCQRCDCNPCRFMGPVQHPPGCTCQRCFCSPCKFDNNAIPPSTSQHGQGVGVAPGASQHGGGTGVQGFNCECEKCVCSPCKFKETIGPAASQHGQGPSIAPGASQHGGETGVHGFNCECEKCVCSPCKFKEASGPGASQHGQGPSIAPGASQHGKGTGVHGFNCECEKCVCSPCKFNEEAAAKSLTAPPSSVLPGSKLQPTAGKDASVHIEGQLHCICPTCTCGEGEIHNTNLDVSQGKFSKPPSSTPSRSQRAQVEQSADTLILPKPNIRDMYPPNVTQSEGMPRIGQQASGKAVGKPQSVKRMDNATLVQSLQKANKESCECKEQIEEIKKTLEKIRCACSEAEYHSTHNVGQSMGKDMRQSSARPFVKQASAFGQTMSGLKMALNNLQSKCKAKDKMIEAMTTELAQRGTPEVFDRVLDMSVRIPQALDYDQAEDVRSLDKLEHEKLAVLYAPTHKKDECTCAEDLRQVASKGVEVRTHKHKKKDRKEKKTVAVDDCECLHPQIVQREEKDCQMIDLVGFEVIDIRRITEDSLIVKWNVPKNQDVQGYDIFVNGSVASKVMSGTRTSAMIHSLDLSKSIQITIYAVTKCGRIEPPAIAIYEIKS
ncbi:uncharacterized protein LOC126739300 isoform X2 [Anthonomus grandis grandis]|uniref:uncharacterized protein LOC126739300 isoform X2 n=1 Tax=Anthonomus grandis grandis TaxID=2921223 RepID=UPI002166A1BE|nr:uncharacterized protein LOC126739300 isoform X2 [Anthonomus grandis grandis]